MTPARAPCAQIRVQLWPAAGELPPQDAPPWVQQAAAPPPGGAGARTWQLWGGPEDEPDDWTAPDPDDSEAGRSEAGVLPCCAAPVVRGRGTDGSGSGTGKGREGVGDAACPISTG